MTSLHLSIGEPFTSPAWGSNFVVFSGAGLVPEQDSKDYIRKACKYARAFGVYTVPESFMVMGHRCLCLISPEGRVLGAQQGIHINTATRSSKHSAGLEVFSTEFGGILLCVDVDIYHPEIARIASTMGAQYMICAQEIAEADYNSSMVFTGAWNAAQTADVFVIDVCNHFHCVCAPLALTRHGDGFIVSPNLRLPATACLQADDLRLCPPRPRLNRRFFAVHRRELLR